MIGFARVPTENVGELIDLDVTRPIRGPDLAVVPIDRDSDAGELGGPLDDLRPRNRHAGALDSVTADDDSTRVQPVEPLRNEECHEQFAGNERVEEYATFYRDGGIHEDDGADAVARHDEDRGGDFVGDNSGVQDTSPVNSWNHASKVARFAWSTFSPIACSSIFTATSTTPPKREGSIVGGAPWRPAR